MSDPDARQILDDLASGNEARRRDATDAIVRLHPDSELDDFAFAAALDSPDDNVVYWAGVALRRLGPRSAAAIPSLLALLRREQLHLRQTAVKALASVGPEDPDARAAVFAALGDDSAFIRREALQSCLTLPVLTADDYAAIAGMATDSDPEVRDLALRGISPQRKYDA
jgi:HEAT repeat protein